MGPCAPLAGPRRALPRPRPRAGPLILGPRTAGATTRRTLIDDHEICSSPSINPHRPFKHRP
eukprot:5492561-Pyramimonas_sp.AAC.1